MIPPFFQVLQMLHTPPQSTADGEEEEKSRQEKPDHTLDHEGSLAAPLVSCDSI